MLLGKYDKKELKSFDLILCSRSNRTAQTANLILKLTNQNLEIKKTNNLSEIFFNPQILTNQKEFKKQGLEIIRTSLFYGMKGGCGAEDLDEVLFRAQKLKNELLRLPHNNILCITHSFYMRVLRLFYLENITKSKEISIEKLTNTIDHNYLEGFEINI
jgi:broad specificity phosphatase PhoE